MKYKHQNGNAIFIILVAIALFAALAYAFNSSSRTSTNLLSDEQAKAYANQIIAYGNEVKSAVKRLQLRGCSDTEISFENNIVSGYTNPNAPTDNTCHVFDVAGGGVQWQKINQSILDTSKSGQRGYEHAFFSNPIQLLGVGTDCNTSNCTDLIVEIPYIEKDICDVINKKTNASYTYTHEGIENFVYRNTDKFQGVYFFYNSGVSSIIGDEPNSMGSNVKIGCYPRDVSVLGGQFYVYYNTLIAR